MIEVTILESGETYTYSKNEFFSVFGKEEGQEILAGYSPNIVAVYRDNIKPLNQQ